MCHEDVTVTLDGRPHVEARLEAARRDVNISSLIRELLTDHMGAQVSYEGSKQRYLARGSSTLSSKGGRYPERADLHDRAGLR
jgi:hypothetical protein